MIIAIADSSKTKVYIYLATRLHILEFINLWQFHTIETQRYGTAGMIFFV